MRLVRWEFVFIYLETAPTEREREVFEEESRATFKWEQKREYCESGLEMRDKALNIVRVVHYSKHTRVQTKGLSRNERKAQEKREIKLKSNPFSLHCTCIWGGGAIGVGLSGKAHIHSHATTSNILITGAYYTWSQKVITNAFVSLIALLRIL